MHHSFRFLFFLATALSLAAQQAPRPEMTARELFYNAAGAPTINTSKTAAAQPPAPKTPSKVVAKKVPAAPPAQQAAAAPLSATPTPAGTGQIVAVSDGSRATAPPPASGTALGLKYTLLKLTGDSMSAAAPSSVFHAGDKIQFSIETNSPGYLYIVSQGSSGTWKPVFPAPEIEGGNNRVDAFHTYTFPVGYRFVFDQQPGDEKLFIVFSRDPKPDFEQLVYSLQGVKAKPAAQPATQAQPARVMSASIDDSAVGRLHQTYARDLVIERVGDDAHPSPDNATQEKAVYVVNPTGNPDSALVADLHLVHR